MTNQENLTRVEENIRSHLDYDPRTLNTQGHTLQALALLLEEIRTLATPVDVFGDVLKFHRKMGIDYRGKPRKLPPDLQKFRSEFLKEELSEYELAVESGDVEKQLDALLDLIYVASGTMQLAGWDGREGWRRVQVANMMKRPAANALESKRGSLFDVIKPEGWVPPDHSDLVQSEHMRKKSIEPEAISTRDPAYPAGEKA